MSKQFDIHTEPDEFPQPQFRSVNGFAGQVSDITERLRRVGNAGTTESRVCLEAVSEIEELRAWQAFACEYMDFHSTRSIADKAQLRLHLLGNSTVPVRISEQ